MKLISKQSIFKIDIKNKFYLHTPTLKLHTIVLGLDDMSTLFGHFMLFPREREKRDRRDSTGDEKAVQGRKENRNESEETEEIKKSPNTLTCYKDSRPCPL